MPEGAKRGAPGGDPDAVTAPGRKARGEAIRPTQADRDKVSAMAGFGILQPIIARIMGCSDRALRKHYRHELDTGTARMVAKVGQTLYNKALSGDTIAAIFFLKARGGWRDQYVEHAHTVTLAQLVEESMKLDGVRVRGGTPRRLTDLVPLAQPKEAVVDVTPVEINTQVDIEEIIAKSEPVT